MYWAGLSFTFSAMVFFSSVALRTDARSKALSTLGFNSDIFEGKFDDNKYVAEMRAKEAGDAPPAKTAAPADPVPANPSAADEIPYEQPPPPEPVTEAQLRDIRAYMASKILTEERLGKTYEAYAVADVTKLNRKQAANVLLSCNKLTKQGE